MYARFSRGFSAWWKRQSSAIKAAWITSIFVLGGAFIQSIPAWIPLWNQSPTTTPITNINIPNTEVTSISIERIRDTILLAPDLVTAEAILADFWREGNSGFHSDHHYDPAGCPNQGYGLAWNIHYDNRFLRDQVLVFSTPQNFTMLPNEGGWYTQICFNPGIVLSPEDVGKLQSAFLQKKHQGQWVLRASKITFLRFTKQYITPKQGYE